MPMHDALRERYIQSLEEENAALRERIALLEQEAGFRLEVPLIFGLTQSEGRIVSLLVARDAATKEALLDAVTKDITGNNPPEIKIVDVYVCKARRKLKPFGLVIETLWGRGYKMPDESKALFKQFLDGTQSAQAS